MPCRSSTAKKFSSKPDESQDVNKTMSTLGVSLFQKQKIAR